MIYAHVNNPVIDHNEGITGDGVIQKIDDVYVMFYFGAFWKSIMSLERAIPIRSAFILFLGLTPAAL